MVESSQAESRQVEDEEERKQAKQASKRKYFKKGGCGGRRGRARICAILMLCTSLGPSASKQASAGQGRTNGAGSSRKEEGSR